MKIFLNLLPPQRKADIVRRFYWRFFLWQWFFMFLVALVVFGVIILFYLQVESVRDQHEINGASIITPVHRDEYVKYEEKFSATNGSVQEAATFLGSHTSFSSLLGQIEAIVPPGVRIDKITTKDYKVFLTGSSKTRDALLSFQDGVKKNQCFEAVNTPLSNLFSETNVEFQIDFLIKQDCLRGGALK